VPLRMMDDRLEVIRQLDGLVPKVVKVIRDQDVLASQVSFTVTFVMDTRAYSRRRAVREIIDAIPNTPPKVAAVPNWDLFGAMFLAVSIVLLQCLFVRDLYRVNDARRHIPNRRVGRSQAGYPVSDTGCSSDNGLAYCEGADPPEWIRRCATVVTQAI